MFRHSGLAQAVINSLKPSQIRRVVAHCRPGGAGAGDGEGRIKRETGLDCGMRLLEPTQLGKGGSHHKMWVRVIAIGLD